MSNNRKIFVISLHRSLTRSTDALISMLGYKTMHFPKYFYGQNIMENVRGKENRPQEIIEELKPLIDSHDSLSDVPIPILYPQLAEQWPDSLFLLVNRDPEAWAHSVQGLLRKRKLSPYNRIQYEHYFNTKLKRVNNISLLSLMGMHIKHNIDVRRFFNEELNEPNRLCVIDAQKEDVGEKICGFLGHSPRSLPRISDNPQKSSIESIQEWVRLCPNKADARYYNAMHLIDQGDTQQAKEELHKAIEIDVNHPKSAELLSNIYYKEGALPHSKELAVDAIQKGLLRPRLYYRISRYYLKTYNLTQSLKYYLKGLYWKLKKT